MRPRITLIPQAHRRLTLLLALTLPLAAQTPTQPSSSSSSSSSSRPSAVTNNIPSTRIAQPEASGSAVTLETSESLFALASALNDCGYDADLAASEPVRASIRQELAAADIASPDASAAHAALCAYVQQHQLADPGRTVAQYVSLALYTSADLTPVVDETELPPDSTQVVNILPLLRAWSSAIHLHALWVNHRPDDEAITARLHDPLTRMILNTNIYLHSPVSSYDGRRFLVLVEPMLAPSAVNARVYGTNYVVVVSPSSTGSFHMDQIRHTYLHYEIEPMVYARAAAMDRLLPLLKPVADAPLDFIYKSDIVALLAECLIKAVEARTMDTGLTRPTRPASRERLDQEHFDARMAAFNREAEAVRRRAVDLDTRQGWILTNYFYGQLINMEHDNISLKDNIGPMVYGMDVDRQRHEAQQIAFLPESTHENIRRVQPPPTGIDLAERKMMQGDTSAAEDIASKTLSDPHGDHARAHYILARIDLLENQPDEAVTHFHAALDATHEPRTLAWSHIYLGRLYDIQSQRKKAVSEYQSALAVPGLQIDARSAAEGGLKQAFALPKREAPVAARSAAAPDDDDNAPIDPSGKAEKQAYKPPPTSPQ